VKTALSNSSCRIGVILKLFRLEYVKVNVLVDVGLSHKREVNLRQQCNSREVTVMWETLGDSKGKEAGLDEGKMHGVT